MAINELQRYGVVHDGKRPREVVLLRSTACSWGRCTFCDYCEDNTNSVAVATRENAQVISHITGEYGVLQVIDSASWTELPWETMHRLAAMSSSRRVSTIIFEGHWMFKDDIDATRSFFSTYGIKVEFILGLESTIPTRRKILNKGLPEKMDLSKIKSCGFNWVNLLYGDTYCQAPGRFYADEVIPCSKTFDYVNISIFTENSTAKNNGILRYAPFVEEFYSHGWCDAIKALGNVFVFDYGDCRAPDHLGGVGNTI